MNFTIPQFIEREPKIVGPFTFKQFVFVGIAGGISLILYFTVPFWLFIIALIVLVGSSLALAFVKVEKINLPVLIKNSFLFIFKSKVYLWRKKFAGPTVFKGEVRKEKGTDELLDKSQLRIAARSSLQDLTTRLEAKSKKNV